MKKALILILCAILAFCAAFPALAEEPASAQEVLNWYEVFVRSYADSDGDGLGDLEGLRGKLPYIAGMGWRGLWLMPVMPSPSYHKYDVTDYMDIDPEYGTLDDFRALIRDAHALGIRVILDLPLNHTALAHPWFTAACEAVRAGETDSEAARRYCFSEKQSSHSVLLEGTSWFYEEQFSGGGMPDLNLDDAALREDILAILAFWLNEMDADGFRLDAVTSYYTGSGTANIAFLSWLKQSCEALKPGSFLVGECWTGLGTIAEYYESGVDCFFLFPASQAEGWVTKAILARSKPAERFASSVQALYEALPSALYAPFMSNHDTGRAVPALQARKVPERVKLAHALISLIGGAAFTYYGEEIGMVGSGDDPNKRLAMYWSDGEMTLQPPGVTQLEYAYPSLAEQQKDPNSLLMYVKRLNELKLSCPGAFTGRAEAAGTGNILTMRRQTWDGIWTAVVNLSLKQPDVFALAEGQTAVCSLGLLPEESAAVNGLEAQLPPGCLLLLYEAAPAE